MATLTFNEYGYIDTKQVEDICSRLLYRRTDTPTSWISQATRELKKLGIPLVEDYCSKDSNLTAIQASKMYEVISYRGHPDKKAKELSFLVNKDGLIKFAKIAKLAGRKSNEADTLLTDIGVDIDTVNKELGLLPKMEQATSDFSPPTPAAVMVVEVEDDTDDETSILLFEPIPEATALTEITCPIYIWKKEDVILSSSFAKLCGVKTKTINYKIKILHSKGILQEGIDFIYLDSTNASAFCVVEKINLNSLSDVRYGLYLLTQLGTNNLSRYLRNERAEAHADGVSLAATVIQDMERNGPNSLWLDHKKITTLLHSVLEVHNKTLDAYNKTLDTHNRLIDTNERLTVAYEDATQAYTEATETNKALTCVFQELRQIPERGPLGRLFSNSIATEVEQVLARKVYAGEKNIPGYLIGNSERRRLFFPGISEAVSSIYLNRVNHKKESWLKQETNSSSLITVESFLREGMEVRQADFFKEIVYEKTTNCFFYFSHPAVGNFQVKRQADIKDIPEHVERSLTDFMRILAMHNDTYQYDKAERQLRRKKVTL
jgi:hypothetical protein